MTLPKQHLIIALLVLYIIINFAFHGSLSLGENFLFQIVNFILYLQITRLSEVFIPLLHDASKTRCGTKINKSLVTHKLDLSLLIGCSGLLLVTGRPLIGDNFLVYSLAVLLIRYIEMEHRASNISYGVGLACSFFEGYLVHVLPGDGAHVKGMRENIGLFESKSGLRFPVAKLFIVVTRSLYSPPDLQQLNPENARLLGHTYVEAIESLQDVKKDVAGVKNRVYRNSVYLVHRQGSLPVPLVAECATPMHTLERVMGKKAMFSELQCADVDLIREEFCAMLQRIIDIAPECKGRCELVYFDDKDPTQNLGEVLLKRIADLEKNYEQIVATRND